MKMKTKMENRSPRNEDRWKVFHCDYTNMY